MGYLSSTGVSVEVHQVGSVRFFKPHSVTLDSLDKVACGQGAFVFINNILGNDPRFEKEAHASRYEDNWIVPAENWKVDEATGAVAITPPTGSRRPDFGSVDSKRLGRPPFVDQAFPEPTVRSCQ